MKSLSSLSWSAVLALPVVLSAATAPADSAPGANPPASTATPAASAAPRGGSGRGARGPAPVTRLTPDNNRKEVPATGAIWTPSPNPNAIGEYPYGPDSVVHDG